MSMSKRLPRRRAAALARFIGRRFLRREDGSMLVLGLFVFMIMLMAGGIAIDAMRAETMRSELQSTLDRSVLAAANLDQPQDAKGVVMDYFDRAGLSEFLDTDSIAVETSTAGGQVSYRKVTAQAAATLDTIFMPVLGFETIATAAGGSAEEGVTDVEISLVLDVSGSMGRASASGRSKIKELQDAAKDFGWYMLCDPNGTPGTGSCSIAPGSVSMSIIPYAEQVSAGETLLDRIDVPAAGDSYPAALDRYDITEEHQNSSCLTFDGADFGTTALSISDDVKRTGHFDPWSYYRYSPRYWTCRTESWRDIRPYVGHHSNVNYIIGNLRAGGNTSIDVGMKWGTALLDPEVRPVIESLSSDERTGGAPATEPDFTGRPFDYGQRNTLKVIVLMTDGMNTSQHYLLDNYRSGMSEVYRNTARSDRFSVYHPPSGQYYYTHDGSWHDAPYGEIDGVTECSYTWWGGYTCQTVDQPGSGVQMTYQEVWETFPTDWYERFSWLNRPVAWWGRSTKDQRTAAICDAAKDQGIIVYTIGFEAPSQGDAVLQDCATTPSYYFDADGLNISEIFGTIASSINTLRLVE